MIAAKTVLADPSELHRKGLRDELSKLEEANLRVVRVATANPDQEMQMLEAELLQRLKYLRQMVRDGTDEEAEKALEAFNTSLKKQELLARAIASKTDDKDKKKEIFDAVEEVETHSSFLPPAIAFSRQDPSDRSARDKLEKNFRDMKDAIQQLTSATVSSPQDR